MVHLVLVLEHPQVDALVGFRTSKESPSHVPLSSSFCYFSRLVVIYPSHLCYSLSCFFLLPTCSTQTPAPSTQHSVPRQPAQHSDPRHLAPALRPPTLQLPVTSTYRDQLARGRVLLGIGQLIRGPARASGRVSQVSPAHMGTSSCIGDWVSQVSANTYGDQLARVRVLPGIGNSYGDQLARVRVLPGIGQHIQGPTRANGQGHSGRRQAIREGGRPFGKEIGHRERRPRPLGRRQTI